VLHFSDYEGEEHEGPPTEVPSEPEKQITLT